MPKTQSASSHAATNPVTHFILGPIFLINLALTIYHAFHDPQHRTLLNLWLIVLAIALVLVSVQMRLYSLRIQDRVIRLEERLRVTALVSAASAHQLALPQLIALRFASDDELPTLVSQALAENLSSAQIKQRIAAWRPDFVRI